MLFRFKPPEMTEDQRRMAPIYEEYAVTAIDSEEDRVIHPYARIIIWGWSPRSVDWEPNISARPVVFELMRRWRADCRMIAALLREDEDDPEDGPWRISDLRLPGDPER